jgi:hypothetical protein
MGMAERRGYRQKGRKVGGVLAFMGMAERRGYRTKGEKKGRRDGVYGVG